MYEEIIQYVQSSPEYQQNTVARHRAYGPLQLLEPVYALWQSMAMDFITDLPLSKGCDQLWVIIHRFTKMAPFILQKKKNKKVEDLATIFAREVWRLYAISVDIISDWDSRYS
jgi:hypothetical protein